VDLTGEYQAGGYIDAQVWRSADPDGTLYPGWTYPTYVAPATEARYYCVLPSFYEVLCDSAATPNSEIGWYCQFDIYTKDVEALSTSILGTAAGFGEEPWHDNSICGIEAYGATGLGDGIRVRTSGWDDGSNEALVPTGNPTGEVDANSVDTVIGGLLPNKSYRLKFYLGARNNTLSITGLVYTINTDGSDGEMINVARNNIGYGLGTASSNMYADVIGIFTTMVFSASSDYLNHIYVDNVYFSTFGFNRNPDSPTWMLAPSANLSTQLMKGDLGDSTGAGTGHYDGVIDLSDLKILADDWLGIGN